MSDQLVLVEKLRRTGAYEEALALCQDLVAETPDDPDLLQAAAAISRDAGHAGLGLPLLERAALIAPDRADLHCALAALLQELGEDAGAEQTYRRAIGADPACGPALAALAGLYEAQGRIPEAIRQFEALVTLDPASLETREALARLLDETGEEAQSLEIRRETMRHAQALVSDAYDRIRNQSLHTPLYEVDEARLAWSYALLSYTAAGTEVARAIERRDPKSAVKTYRDMLRVLADASEQAQTVDGLRRTFEDAANAFAHCHAKLASLQETFGNPAGAVYHLEEAWRAARSASYEDRARLGELALKCAPDIAGIRDAVAAYHGKMPLLAAIPITRWDFARHARGWLADASEARRGARIEHPRRIAVAGFNPHHIQLFFAMACVLYARGHTIDFLWMPCIDYERVCEPEPVYSAWDEVLLAREMSAFAKSGLPEGFRLVDVRDLELAPSTPEYEAAADRQAFVDIRNHYRMSLVDIEQEPMKGRKRTRYLKDLDAMRRIESYLATVSLDRFVLFNAAIMEYGAAFDVARKAGVTVVEWEQGPVLSTYYSIGINRTNAEIDVRALWEADAGSAFTDERYRRVAEWCLRNGRPDWRGAVPRRRHVPDAAARALLADLGLDPDKPTVALYPNVTWDTATLDRDVAFSSVADWAVRTGEFFERHPEWQLVIRTHPAEMQTSDEFVGEIVKKRWPTLPSNMALLETEEPNLGYRLLGAAQFGLYYTGTLGLEMAMMGIVGITPARPPVGGFGFTREAATPESYFEMIERALLDPEGSAMTADEIERAWRFADLYMVQMLKTLPWSYRQFWPSILEKWPMACVLGEEGRKAFGDIFAVFAGEVDLPDGMVGGVQTIDDAMR